MKYGNENTTFDSKQMLGAQGKPVIQKYNAAPLNNGPGG